MRVCVRARFKTGSHCIALASLELELRYIEKARLELTEILLPLALKCLGLKVCVIMSDPTKSL